MDANVGELSSAVLDELHKAYVTEMVPVVPFDEECEDSSCLPLYDEEESPSDEEDDTYESFHFKVGDDKLGCTDPVSILEVLSPSLCADSHDKQGQDEEGRGESDSSIFYQVFSFCFGDLAAVRSEDDPTDDCITKDKSQSDIIVDPPQYCTDPYTIRDALEYFLLNNSIRDRIEEMDFDGECSLLGDDSDDDNEQSNMPINTVHLIYSHG